MLFKVAHGLLIRRKLTDDEQAWLYFFFVFGSLWMTIVMLLAGFVAADSKIKDRCAVAALIFGCTVPTSLFTAFALTTDRDIDRDDDDDDDDRD
ncbi:hypothetical protein H6F43_03675 [Leptolyngbya sp. FACHB-36]|uniref:hypothetical protein n=1 Tax=Leptolyngbya sp. FACHB-36 TaxID=2692808 RepID=UPI00168037DB|nr:hypothetical protein [Leptolyngbya sp. FACHB-36]MBD2019281.1 hypothetical protein [Leptolyngbya sp. FACHB-36]